MKLETFYILVFWLRHRKILSTGEINVLQSDTHWAVWLQKKSDPRFEQETTLLVTFFYFIYLSQVNLKS